jgi:pimeloyl-ACP methyl ester carboxylesterase
MRGTESLLLRRRLASNGFDLRPFRYPSTRAPVAEILERLHVFVRAQSADRVHLVGHSLGGLVIYRLFERFPEQPPGRVVFLGTPSVESRTALEVARRAWLGSLLGRAVGEELLRPHARSWSAPRELGILAGTSAVGLGRLFSRFDEASDGTVAVRETRLPGATEYRALPVSHTGMLLAPSVARETAHFLAHGRFSSAR